MNNINTMVLVLSLWASSFAIAAPAGRSSPVVVVDVTEHTLEQEISLSGTVEALQQSRLSSRVAGVVDAVFITEGARVDAGQKLFTLDSAIAKVEVATARALVDEATALHNDAQRRVAENRSLANSNHVAATALATAVAEAEATSATLARRRSELQRLQVLLDRHTLTAPFAGIIAEKNVAVGQWITADAPALQLVALDDLRIRATVPQQYLAQLGQDAHARVNVDALPGETFAGTVSALVSVGSAQTRSFPVLIDMDNRRRRLAPGMSARVFVTLQARQSAVLMVPRDALVLRADGSRIVWRVREEDGQYRAYASNVLIGRALGDQVELLDSDLSPGDRIVLLGNENLRPGQAVHFDAPSTDL